jgi:hypothetical protein
MLLVVLKNNLSKLNHKLTILNKLRKKNKPFKVYQNPYKIKYHVYHKQMIV